MPAEKSDEVGHVEVEDRYDHDGDLKQSPNDFNEVTPLSDVQIVYLLTITRVMRLDTRNIEKV